MRLKSVAERIEREHPELGLTYGNLKKLKFRGRIMGTTEQELYEQTVIYLYMRKDGYKTKEILEARRYWSGEREDRHQKAILLNFGVYYRKEGINQKELISLRRLGQAILTYGYYLHSIRSGVDFVNNEVSFKVILSGSNLIYTIKEVVNRAETKTKEKEYILAM